MSALSPVHPDKRTSAHVSGHRAGVAGIYNRLLYTAEKRAALGLGASHIRFGIAPENT
jgi:hypothetical protein